MSVLFAKGVRVKHPGKPEWGLGQVLENSSYTAVRIFFVGAGERNLSLEFVNLLTVTGPEAHHLGLDNLKRDPSGKRVTASSLPQAISRFLERYPEGFYGQKYLGEERDYKVKAHRRCLELLSEQAIAHALQAQQFDEICKGALQVVNATNLIFPNEIMALKDGLVGDHAKKHFAEALHNLLFGTADFEARFNAFGNVLYEIGAAKWTTATYFPFLMFPETQIFLKPTITKKAADLCAFEINYRPDVNWITYRQVLLFANELRKHLADLKPRDMIDVQSFMWCIARDT